VKYACIARHQGEYSVRLMCHVLSVSPAGFYASQQRAPSRRLQYDAYLRPRVRAIHERSGRTYGSPRVRQVLQGEGERVGKHRVARLLREEGLVARPRRRWVATTQSAHAEPPAPNRLGRRFALAEVPALDRVWVCDITYLPTRQGWLYLAIVLDLASRRVVGWAMRDTLSAELALAALDLALATRQPAAGLVHHSDRGIQYACAAYQQRLSAHGMIASMSRRGNCWDNAVAESFFATLELELVMQHTWATRDEARGAVFRYIEGWYNRERQHSTLGYRSPADYEREITAA
jgi:putative transposase